MAQTNEGQRAFADLQKKYAPKQAALKSLSDEIDGLTKQLQTQGATLSDADRAYPRQDHRRQEEAAGPRHRGCAQRLPAGHAGHVPGLASKVYDVMQSYAQQQGFTLILDISQQQSPVLYASEGPT